MQETEIFQSSSIKTTSILLSFLTH